MFHPAFCPVGAAAFPGDTQGDKRLGVIVAV